MSFLEYLGFTMDPASPAVLLPAQRDEVKKIIETGWTKFPAPVRKGLVRFDQTWHLIRAAWLGAPVDQTTRWREILSKPWTGVATPTIEEKTLDAILLPDLWTEMASFAASLGETGAGWTATPAVRVW
jgi:hypothetical protein